jgi:hypothetical protein
VEEWFGPEGVRIFLPPKIFYTQNGFYELGVEGASEDVVK